MYKRHTFCTAIGFMQYIGETLALNETRAKEGKPPFKMGLDIYGGSFDAYEVMGVYDLLTFHADLDIEVRVLAEATLLDLAMLAGAKEGMAYVSKSTQILPFEVGGVMWGEYKDLKLAEESLMKLRENVFSTITSCFNITRDTIDTMIKEKTLLSSADCEAMGMRILGTQGEEL